MKTITVMHNGRPATTEELNCAVEGKPLPLLYKIKQSIQEAKNDQSDVIAEMPNEATTERQRALQTKHGTPREFAIAVVNSIGEISVLEALVAIRKYRNKWEDSQH